MKSLLAAFQHKYLFLTAFSWGWFEVAALPKPMLLILLFVAMMVDLGTGLVKSWQSGIATSSNGFRKTVTKLCTYTGAILGVWLLANIINSTVMKFDYSAFVNSSIGFLSFIEIYSIFENLYLIDPESKFSKRFAAPLLKFLRGRIKEHPITGIIDSDEEKEVNKK